jgi:hypothetical protein
MKMQMTIEKITPAKAVEYIATVDTSKQRPLKQSKINDYASAMSHGHWVITHQGIAFDDEGNLCDGQHRMHAVVKSGVTVEMQVTRNLIQKQGDLFTFDAIDQGVKRNIGEQLHVRHNVANANQVAAGAKKIVHLCTAKNPVMSVANTLAVIKYYEKELQDAISMLRGTRALLRAPVVGAAAFCLRVGGAPVRSFVELCGTGENIGRGNPAFAFRNYALNNYVHGGGVRGQMESAFCVCAMHAMLGNEIKLIKPTNRGIDFFADKQQRAVKAICDMFEI